MVHVKNIRSEICSNELRPYDDLETSPKGSGQYLINKLIHMQQHGWTRWGQSIPTLSPPINWHDRRGSFDYSLHGWEPLTYFLHGFSMTKKKEYFDLSFAFAWDWYLENQKEPLKEDRTKTIRDILDSEQTPVWYDMAVGLRTYRLAYLVDVVARDPEYSDEVFNALHDSLLFHHELLSQKAFFKQHSNHGIYQALGQLAASKRFDYLKSHKVYWSIASKRIEKIFDHHFFESGVHKEHSPGYHYMVLGSFIGAASGGLLEGNEQATRFEKMEEALGWMIQPDGWLSSIGDSDPRRLSQEPGLAARFTSPLLQHVTTDGKIGGTLPTGVKLYKHAGYAFARMIPEDVEPIAHNASYLAQHAGFHSRVHKHADHLGFIWYDKTREILVDPGRYAYEGKTQLGSELFDRGFWYADPKRIYVESTHAHNCLEIDGKSYPRRGTGGKPFQSALKYAAEQDGLAVTECEITHVRYVRHWRGLIMSPGRFLLVLDWLNDRTHTRDYRQWFKFHSDWDITSDGERLRGTAIEKDDKPPLSLMATSLLRGTKFGQVYRGQDKPDMKGWMSDAAYSLIPAPAVAAEQLGQNMASFATLFSLGDVLEVDEKTNRANASLKKAQFSWRDSQGQITLEVSRGVGQHLKVNVAT